METKHIGIIIGFFIVAVVGFYVTKGIAGTEVLKKHDDAISSQVASIAGEEQGMKSKTYSAAPPMTIDLTKTYLVTMVTSKGTMKIVLSPSDAPKTVNNFVFLAKDGFYDNTVFHRIIKGFMIQGGDPQGNGSGGPGYRFDDEKITKDYVRGTIAMANAGPNTNGSQFFIMHADYALPKNYVIFGSIDQKDESSLKTLDSIATTPTSASAMGEQSSPVQPVTVEKVTVEEE